MAENKSTETRDTEEQAVDYAFWETPGKEHKVIYSLQLFHEIDFVVNEGYRKIPHGGIEVGGLLFGSIDAETVRIEAFRSIDCEHSSGPSLQLSERDLGELEKQIKEASTDRELQNYRPVGWFLAHTRGAMELTEAEAKQFDRFFPAALQLTVIVKPERFQPTRFGFLVRPTTGDMPREATSLAVILPLPGRSHKPGQLIASIAAPTATTVTKRSVAATPPPTVPPPSAPGRSGRRKRVVEKVVEDEAAEDFEEAAAPPPRRAVPAPKQVSADPMGIWKVPPEADVPEMETDEVAGEEPMNDPRTPEERAARKQLARDRARVMDQAFPPMPVFRPAPLPSLPANAARPLAYDRPMYPSTGGTSLGGEQTPRVPTVFNPRSLTALALAALAGCLVGYIGYLQLPAPVIPLDVRASSQTIVVSWPPDETRNSIYAAIRFNDGAPVPLSAEEKTTGRVSLAAVKDFKVEVMSRNWMRDSRGIVRYMHSANGNGQVAPIERPPIE